MGPRPGTDPRTPLCKLRITTQRGVLTKRHYWYQKGSHTSPPKLNILSYEGECQYLGYRAAWAAPRPSSVPPPAHGRHSPRPSTDPHQYCMESLFGYIFLSVRRSFHAPGQRGSRLFMDTARATALVSHSLQGSQQPRIVSSGTRRVVIPARPSRIFHPMRERATIPVKVSANGTTTA